MLETNKLLYSLSDVSIIPSEVVTIESRSECIPFINNIEGTNSNYYPIVVAPMASIISEDNYKIFNDNKISCIIPRNIELKTRLKLCRNIFCAFSLKEVEDNFIVNKFNIINKIYILIDIANGHLQKQLTIGSKLKQIYGSNVVLMGGNIANPDTYLYYNYSGFDYVRVGIGGGSGCLTSTQTSIHYPMASLLDNISKIRCNINIDTSAKVIADGGIGSYSDAIKCLALGADYVMMGRVFAKAVEACGDTYVGLDGKVYRHYYGMSTKEAQAKILGKSLENIKEKLKTSEGKTEELEVEYTISGWIDNFNSYLRSAMSYTNSRSLSEFKNSRCNIISLSSSNFINNK